MEELIESMKRTFATHFQYYVKAHGFHVNVVGPNFTQYHDLFGKIYEHAQEEIDNIAEQIRAIEGIAPFSMTRIMELGDIKDSKERPKAEQMVVELLADSQTLENHYMESYDMAEEINAAGLCNYLGGLIDAHKKYQWMLRSTLE
jgi:starvation-inducible DNA-binding protein